jgi:hypothetical protein
LTGEDLEGIECLSELFRSFLELGKG